METIQNNNKALKVWGVLMVVAIIVVAVGVVFFGWNFKSN